MDTPAETAKKAKVAKWPLVCLVHMQYKTFRTAAVIFATNGQNGQGFSYWL